MCYSMVNERFKSSYKGEYHDSVGFMYHYDTLLLAISITYLILIFLINKKMAKNGC